MFEASTNDRCVAEFDFNEIPRLDAVTVFVELKVVFSTSDELTEDASLLDGSSFTICFDAICCTAALVSTVSDLEVFVV